MSVAIKCETIPQILAMHRQADDGAEFLRLVHPGHPDEVFSYSQVVARAAQWAHVYRSKGIAPGDVVVVILRHALDLYAAYLGALQIAAVPTMFAFPSAKLSEDVYFRSIHQLLDNAGGSLIATYPELATKLVASGVKHDLILTPSEVSSAGAEAAFEDVSADAVAFLQYSSGTTGLKKGVAVTHRALLWQVRTYAETIQATSADRIVTWLPLYHDMGLITCFFMPFLLKLPVVAISPHDWVQKPRLWLEAASTHRATLSWLPNFAYTFMTRSIPHHELTEFDLGGMRAIINCSEPVLAESHDRFLAHFSAAGLKPEALLACYAMAENTFAVTNSLIGRGAVVDRVAGAALETDGHAVPVATGEGSRRLVSSGRALPETGIRIVDAAGQALPDRRLGEIVIQAPCLMAGYHRNSEATQASMQDGWFATGDLGYLVDGELFVVGRKKDLIIIGGKNIYPQDIEAAVNNVPGVSPGRVVAFGVPDDAEGTEQLVVLAETDAAADADRLIQDIRQAVAGATEVTARDIQLVAPRWLEKSSSGKISRASNRSRYLAELRVRKAMPAADGGGDPIRAAVLRCLRGRGYDGRQLGEDTPLITSGLIDSFALFDLLIALEAETGTALPDRILEEPAALDTLAAIRQTLATLTAAPAEITGGTAAEIVPIQMQDAVQQPVRQSTSFWTLLYRAIFRWKGIPYGPGLQVLGPLLLEINGQAGNIRIGRNVTLMPGVHLKNRENGRIILNDGVKLDSYVRVVAANQATIEIGARSSIGIGTIINAGADVLIGRGTAVAGYCQINSSDHVIGRAGTIQSQGYVHKPVRIGEDVWLGGHSFVAYGSTIGAGAVVSTLSIVNGAVPSMAIVQGRPARVIKYRR